MANKKISELTALTEAASADLLPIVDDSESETKKITLANLIASMLEAEKMAPYQNILTNSGFGVWSNSTLENYGAAIADDDCADDDTADWTKAGTAALSFDTDHYEFSTSGGEGRTSLGNLSFKAGHLYLIQCDIKDGTQAGATLQLKAYDGASHYTEVTTTAGWVTESCLFEAGSTTATGWAGIYETDDLSGNNIEIKNFTCYEVTPGCIAANALGPDGWSHHTSGVDLWREPNGDNTKSGSYFAMKITPALQDDYVYFPNATIATFPFWYKRFQGKTLTFGAWVKSSTANDARIAIYTSEDGYTYSSYHSGGGSYEWLEVTATVNAAASSLYAMIRFSNASPGTAYMSQPILVFGSSIGEGNYSSTPGEWVYTEAPIIPADWTLTTSGISTGAAIINLEVQSKGMIPKGALAVLLLATARDSNSAGGGNCYIHFGRSSSNYYALRVDIDEIDDDLKISNSGIVPCDSNGDIYYSATATGSGTMDVSLNIVGVQLR